MSRTRHPRNQARKYSNFRRNAKEWKGDSHWKPKERVYRQRKERRSKRRRSGDVGQLPPKALLARNGAPACAQCGTWMHRTNDHATVRK